MTREPTDGPGSTSTAADMPYLPLLDLNADEVAALRALARDLLPGTGWVTPALRSALDKLTTSTEELS